MGSFTRSGAVCLGPDQLARERDGFCEGVNFVLIGGGKRLAGTGIMLFLRSVVQVVLCHS